MNDVGTDIPVIFDSKDLKLDEFMKSNERVVLGYVFVKYETAEDLSLIVYYKRDNTMTYENTDTYTISSSNKRFFQKLPLHLSVIDAYVKITGDVSSLEITSVKLLVKPAVVGKYGG